MAKPSKAIIEEGYKKREWDSVIFTNLGCGGGVNEYLTKLSKRIAVDIDGTKTNVFKCVQETPYKLVEECKKLAKNISEGNTTFKELSNAHFKSAAPHQPNVEHAARYLFLNANSCRNALKNLLKDKESPEKQAEALLKKEQAIYNIHTYISSLYIENENMFDIIREYKNKQKCLFVVDPPYLLSSGYGSSFGLDEHKELCSLLQKISGDFILFCRVTEKKSKGKDKDPAPINLDCFLQNFYNRIYGKSASKKQCYYIDIAFDCYGTTERIITSFPFKGATKYD